MASPNVVTLTNANFAQEVLESKVPVLVDFWAPWCGPCRMIAPLLDEIADNKAGTAKVGKVNVDDESSLAQQYGVMNLPTILFFKNGAPADQQVGQTSKAVLVAKLDKLA